jgi:hypothetical protein
MREIVNGQVMWPASGRAKQSSRPRQPGSRNQRQSKAKQPGTAARELSWRCIQHTVPTYKPGLRGGCPRRHGGPPSVLHTRGSGGFSRGHSTQCLLPWI